VMSKKLAVGTDLILLDVKAGSGAFMKTVEDAEALAGACAELASGWGRRARVAVTDMSQPLGEAVGNALDVAEAVEVLGGGRPGPLTDLSLEFATAAQVALLDIPDEEARSRSREAISSGRALETFSRMVEAQGGDPRVVDDPAGVLPSAPLTLQIPAPADGYLETVEAEEIGRAAVGLGAGRARKGDPIDPATGILFRARIGDRLENGEPIGEVHARTEDEAGAAIERVLSALTVSETRVEAPPLVYGWRDAQA
jgi:pyrimidine-nucleoside phosphorylase